MQQQALRDFDQALRNWWGGSHRRPRWRKAGVNEGFCVRDVRVRRINRRWGEMQVPKAGWARFRLTRPWADIEAAGSARVSLDRAGRWHVSFTALPTVRERRATGAAAGLDMGVAHTVTTSDGAHLDMPVLASRGEAGRRLRLERKLARQQKGSRRRERTKAALAKLRAREADRRKDWIEKTTTALVARYDMLCIEDLAVKNMVRSARGTVDTPGVRVRAKAGLNREITARAWGAFRRRLEDKAAASGVAVVAVNPAGTSQRCHNCGHSGPDNRESQAVFRCRACRWAGNADINAAINILAAGQAVTGRGDPPSGRSAKRQPPEPVAA